MRIFILHLATDRFVALRLRTPNRASSKKKQILSILDQIDKLKRHEKRLLSLLLLTGMRRGEVLSIRWEDIDANAGLIHVQRNVTYAKNQPHIGTPKTKQGERDIPLNSMLWKLLQLAQNEGFIIGNDKPITLMAFRCCWKRIEKQVDMCDATPHIFRHSYLTLANNAGVDMKTLQDIGGHAHISTAMDIYVSKQTDQIIYAVEKIEAHLYA